MTGAAPAERPHRRLVPDGGVEVPGDGRPPPAALVRDLVAEHGLLVVHDAGVPDPDACAAFAATLGAVVPPPFLPEVRPGTGVSSLEHATPPQELRAARGVVFASGWHCDWSFLDRPPTLSLLWCETAPDVGGDTLFCDTAGALPDRSAPFAAFLRGLTAEHSSGVSFAADGVYDRRPVVGAAPPRRAASLSARHPAVLRSPLSGAECVFLNPAYTTRLVELTEDESAAVLGVVFSTLFWEEHVIRVRWRPGTLAVWDNHRLAHRALNQGVSGPRRLLRANVRHDG